MDNQKVIIHRLFKRGRRWQPEKPIHFVISSLFTHHLTEPDIIRFLQWMETHAELGWFVNDLSRARIPYLLLPPEIISKLAGLHPFVQHPSRAPLFPRTGEECAQPPAFTPLSARVSTPTLSHL